MTYLGGRLRRHRVLGPVRGARAPRRSWLPRALMAVALFGTVMAIGTVTASANAAQPTAAAVVPGDVVVNANGTVTVSAGGSWLWPFGQETDHTSGLEATVKHPCDSRTGVGWGMVWNDPDDPGFAMTYTTKARYPALTQVVHVGSRGVDPSNTDDQVEYNATKPCGTFVQTNIPGTGDGYDTGSWMSTHTYASVADLPKEVCVITYDLGLAHPPGPHRISFANNDNSVQWGLFENGYWDTSTSGKNCSSLPTPVAAPPTPPPPVVKTVSNTVPPRAVTPVTPVVTKPTTALAFTGVGEPTRLLVVIGTLLLLAGAVLLVCHRRKLDVRRLISWLLGY